MDIWVRAASERGLALESLLTGVPYSVDHIKDKRKRIDWDAFAMLLSNVGAYWSRDELVEIGRRVIRNPYLKYFAVVGRALMSAQDFYGWVFREGSGAGNQTFSNVIPKFSVLAPNVVRLAMKVPEPYRESPEFFHISHGNFQEMSTMVGLPPAKVEMTVTGREATYVVKLPEGGGVIPRVVRSITNPFRAREVAAELRDAHTELKDRLDQLQLASGVIEQKKHELEVIQVVAAAAHASLDLEAALRAICVQVCGQLNYHYARFAVIASQDGVDVSHIAEFGGRKAGDLTVDVPLTFRGVKLGELSAARSGAITDDERRFLGEVATACALAINNAIAFQVIQSYRKALEDRVTERTAQLNSALEQVKLQQTARQRIFQNISHELRTPLSLISLSTGDIAYRETGLTATSRQRLEQIDDSIQRLLHLFDGMLLLAAGQEGKLRIRPMQTDIAIELRSLVSAWQVAADKHGIHLNFVGPERLSIRCDEAGVGRVVSNLISNAIKFTANGGSVEVRLEEPDAKQVRISVQDSGVGMDKEFLSRVFGRFEQGPAPVRTGERGSGIGLAIVKEIAEAHGGEATVESERGKGSCFMITLPREQDLAALAARGEGSFIPALQQRAPEHETSAVATTNDAAPVDKSAAVTVLVAEDDPALRQFIVDLLSRDYRVVAAADGLAALRMVKEHQPAILVSDIGMPGIDGIELTRRFRAQSADKLAPVILLTAYAMVETRMQGLEAGAIDYVTKPFHPEELLARVKGQLQLRGMAMRLHESQKLAGLGILSAGLAHELRNPANGVVNSIMPLRRLLPKETFEPGTPTAMLFEALSTGAEQIAVLTKQLLGFSRQGELEVREEAMSRILDSAEALVEPALAGRRIRRDLKYKDGVRCARGLVVQVLVNLLENSAHASPPGSEIVLSTRVENGFVCFDVKDSGPGVPKELRDRIFDPFFTTKPPGQGTGLGLAISKMIAERHGGNLRLLEGEKGGAFRLELPERRVALPTSSPLLGAVPVGSRS
ncbi:MAG: response regulator [Myxococcaceae bacterium]|nr:response regulator [Myxococcaceae bacterium]